MKRTVAFTLIFVATLIGSTWAHELGHTVAAFTQGVPAIPTPLKEYALQDYVEWQQEIWISFGGVAATIFLTMGSWGWIDERTIELVLRYIESPHTETITCRFDGAGVTVTIHASIQPADKFLRLTGVARE